MSCDKKVFEGIFPPLSIFCDEAGNIDAAATNGHIDRLIDAGVNGFLLLGSAGEFFAMTTEQRKKAAESCLKHINGRVPALVGTGACGTTEMLDLSKHAVDNGADGLMIINPYYSGMSDDCLLDYYCAAADASSVPVLVYNFPAMTGQDLSVEFIARLADANSNIRGVKDSVTDIAHTHRLIIEVAPKHPGFSVFSGFDDHVLSNLALGGAGGIPGTVNFAPQFACGLYSAFKAGEYEKAFEFHKTVALLTTVYGIETPYFGTLKEAVKLCGAGDVPTNVVPPAKPLTAAGEEKLKALLESCGLC